MIRDIDNKFKRKLLERFDEVKPDEDFLKQLQMYLKTKVTSAKFYAFLMKKYTQNYLEDMMRNMKSSHLDINLGIVLDAKEKSLKRLYEQLTGDWKISKFLFVSVDALVYIPDFEWYMDSVMSMITNDYGIVKMKDTLQEYLQDKQNWYIVNRTHDSPYYPDKKLRDLQFKAEFIALLVNTLSQKVNVTISRHNLSYIGRYLQDEPVIVHVPMHFTYDTNIATYWERFDTDSEEYNPTPPSYPELQKQRTDRITREAMELEKKLMLLNSTPDLRKSVSINENLKDIDSSILDKISGGCGACQSGGSASVRRRRKTSGRRRKTSRRKTSRRKTSRRKINKHKTNRRYK